MIKNFRILLLIVLFVAINTDAPASSIAFVNLDNILQKSNLGIKTLDKLKERKKLEEKEVNDREKNIKILEEEIRNKQNIISNDEFKVEVNKLQKNIENFNLYKKKVLNDYEKYKNDEIINFFDQINPLIQNYLSENSIDILFNNKNIIIGKDTLDITDKIINIINQNIK